MEHQQAIEKMKQIIAHNVVIVYPNFELPFKIQTDATHYQLEAVIIKKQANSILQ